MRIVRDTLCKQLTTQYPNLPMYIKKMPNGFSRPSFYVRFVDVMRDQDSAYFVDKFIFEIVHFAPLNSHNEVDNDYLMDNMSKLLNLFTVKSLRLVNNRGTLYIDDKRATQTDGEIILNITLTLTNYNNELVGADVEGYEPMEELYYQVKE